MRKGDQNDGKWYDTCNNERWCLKDNNEKKSLSQMYINN